MHIKKTRIEKDRSDKAIITETTPKMRDNRPIRPTKEDKFPTEENFNATQDKRLIVKTATQSRNDMFSSKEVILE